VGKRGSGILLHLSSLPSSFGIGDLGPWAYRFGEFLAEARQSYWQILPLNPTAPVYANSPYLSTSAFACNPLFISPELLLKDDLLLRDELSSSAEFTPGKVNYEAVHYHKNLLLARAFERFQEREKPPEYERFCREQSYWLEDFALFKALKTRYGGKVWSDWSPDLRDRRPEALQSARQELSRGLEREKFLQYIFFQQWSALKSFCNQRGIQIIGDIPIYVNYDSSDVWVHPELFKLDEQKKPYVVAGVPPDYFSATGQLWGNPVYEWEVLKERNYEWWIQRTAHNLMLFDLVRIDHFRGLVAFWEVPAMETTAVHGRWTEAPAMDFFSHVIKKFPHLPVIAEDLGIITPDVEEVMKYFRLPGMKVLLFAFGQDLPTNPYIPHNLPRDCVAYTGTHDNNTVRGWFEQEATPDEKKNVRLYLGREVAIEDLSWELIRLLMMSATNTTIFPMQDILGLGEEARMNRPSTQKGNWEWRLSSDQMAPAVAYRLREMAEIYGRGRGP
jgi:4-alpha-glucanotransferase